MANTVIQVEKLGKQYIIGHQKQGGYTTLRDQLTRGAKSLGRQLVSTVNGKSIPNPIHEEFWALKDVSFEIKQGDVVGIIGRNGAGKSTLLKILSRITEPTSGEISITGRVASLLEVGTGFHPELTGRENIYLNGAILGMSKVEIKKKFDEIVAFSEVEKFLDTPVKRYSSGMYVRLAFAVAAHLEPEILIVDEVLAVGDVNFQKKCLGKIEDISQNQGRTVLFISHNMDTIQRLCSHCVMLEKGKLISQGTPASTILQYISSNSYQAQPNQWIDLSNVKRMGTGEVQFVALQYSSLNEATSFQPYSNGFLEFLLLIESDVARSIASLAVTLYSQNGTKLVNAEIASIGQVVHLQKGSNQVRIRLNNLPLNPDTYILGLWVNKTGKSGGIAPFDFIEFACKIEVVDLVSEDFGIKEKAPVFCKFELLEVTQAAAFSKSL